MAYPEDTWQVLSACGYSDTDYVVGISKDAGVVLEWHHTDPQPTPQQVSDWETDAVNLPNGQTFTEWQAENVGDGTAAIRFRIKRHLLDAVENKNKDAVLLLATLHGIRKGTITSGMTAGQVLTALTAEVDDLIT